MLSNRMHLKLKVVVLPFLVLALLIVPNTAVADNKYLFQVRKQATSLIAEERFLDAVKVLEEYSILLGKKFGHNNPVYALSVADLGILNNTIGQFDQAENLLLESLSTTIAALGTNHPNVSYISNALGDVYFNKFQFSLAEEQYLRAVIIEQKSMPTKSPRKALTFLNLAKIYREKGKYNQAQQFLDQSFDLSNTFIDEITYINALNTKALLNLDQGNWHEAQETFERAFNALSRFENSDTLEVKTLNNLGLLATERADYAKAERILRNALTISESTFGIEHNLSRSVLHNLGNLYFAQGRAEEALVFYIRILEIEERNHGFEHPALTATLFQIASIYLQNFEIDLASKYTEQAYNAAKKAYGEKHPMIAKILVNQAQIAESLGDYSFAEKLYLSSIQMWKNLPGLESAPLGYIYNNLGLLYLTIENFELAEMFLDQALEENVMMFGDKHPVNITVLNNLAYLKYINGDKISSLHYFQKSSKLMLNRSNAEIGYDLGMISEKKSQKENFILYAKTAIELYNETGLQHYLSEAFEASQMTETSMAGESVKAVLSMLSLKDKEFDKLWRRKLTIEEKIRQADQSFLNQLTISKFYLSKQKIKQVLNERNQLDRSLTELKETLRVFYPDADASDRNKVFSVIELQNLLSPSEILIKILPGYKKTLLFSITKNSATVKILNVSDFDINETVRLLRQGLEIKPQGNLPNFDVVLAHQLYTRIIKPIEIKSESFTHILFDTSGALETLPLSVLPITIPKSRLLKKNRYEKVTWLGERYAISNVLGISTFFSMRNNPMRTVKRKAFLGIGDPNLGYKVGKSRGFNFTDSSKNDTVDIIQQINMLPKLPETRTELTNMARLFDFNSSTLIFGEDANEENLKRMDLKRYNIISIASHAILADELMGFSEPGIILTPPLIPTKQNDGILTSAEIAQLSLNADWVILSACNTAGSDGKTANEAFSGLARSFFYAGARTILASHWPVVSKSTSEFTNLVFAEYEKSNVGKAEAHRKAIKRFLRSKNILHAHPSIWGAFSIIGDGR